MDTQDLITKLKEEKKSANDIQFHKHDDWNSNYELYRNKVKTNRLTQRQAVNIPLMKETIKTLLSKIDEAPTIDWKELGGDEQKEIYYQEIWDSMAQKNKLELVDVLDKKNVLLYGISGRKLNITENGVEVDVTDNFDIAYDPLMSSGEIETARFIIHQNIFKSLRDILADDRYTKKGKDELRVWITSPEGITQGADNKEKWEQKMERIKSTGLDHKDFPLFAGGDRIVNLTEHFTTLWNTKEKKWERRVIVYADERTILMDELLEDLIGVKFWPFVIWSEDPETNDIYPDSVADLVRTPNQVLNVWFSQMIENRTLKNFQMHWFLPGQNYTPQTYVPGPGVMLPAPPGDDINKVIKPVEISGLDDTMQAIQALTTIVERGTGATAIEKGQAEKGTQTLGEIEILVGKSVERTIGMAKFYRMAWYELAVKWNDLMHANAPEIIKVYKQGRSGRIYEKKLFATDWKSSNGYRPTVASTSEQEANSVKNLQRFQFLLQQFPDNVELKKIAQKRMLELVDFSPDELKAVQDAEDQQSNQFGEMINQINQPQQPQQQESPQQIQSLVDQLVNT